MGKAESPGRIIGCGEAAEIQQNTMNTARTACPQGPEVDLNCMRLSWSKDAQPPRRPVLIERGDPCGDRDSRYG